jgi:hypothetical protein
VNVFKPKHLATLIVTTTAMIFFGVGIAHADAFVNPTGPAEGACLAEGTGGIANGCFGPTFAISGTGTAGANSCWKTAVAVSVLGSACAAPDGNVLGVPVNGAAISGTGPASGDYVAVSGTNSAQAGVVAVSGTGVASSGLVAVSGTNSANAPVASPPSPAGPGWNCSVGGATAFLTALVSNPSTARAAAAAIIGCIGAIALGAIPS